MVFLLGLQFSALFPVPSRIVLGQDGPGLGQSLLHLVEVALEGLDTPASPL
jgi:hypothetical protein